MSAETLMRVRRRDTTEREERRRAHVLCVRVEHSEASKSRVLCTLLTPSVCLFAPSSSLSPHPLLSVGSEIGTFSKTVGALTDILTSQSEKIETEKLRAIGQRTRKEAETETRKRRQQDLQFLIAQKQSELQRLHDQFESLQKVEQEQKLITEKLSKN